MMEAIIFFGFLTVGAVGIASFRLLAKPVALAVRKTQFPVEVKPYGVRMNASKYDVAQVRAIIDDFVYQWSEWRGHSPAKVRNAIRGTWIKWMLIEDGKGFISQDGKTRVNGEVYVDMKEARVAYKSAQPIGWTPLVHELAHVVARELEFDSDSDHDDIGLWTLVDRVVVKYRD